MLENYFSEGPYRFEMRFGRGTFTEFYGATSRNAEILAERRKLLATDPHRYLVLAPDGEELLDETLEWATELNKGSYFEKARRLGEFWEPDYLLLSRSKGQVRLECACVCFPSSWSVEEKIGKSIEEIHAIVPGLNDAIGKQIGIFLEKLKPGFFWTRTNWGLSRSPDRNQHPTRGLPRLDASVSADEVFFRVEEQSLTALPNTNGVLFGIRIKVWPLSEFFGTPAGVKLRLALETMPPEMARYKGLAAARERIIGLLR